MKAFRVANPDLVSAVSEAERVELDRLRQEIRELIQEREFLGEAAALFRPGGTSERLMRVHRRWGKQRLVADHVPVERRVSTSGHCRRGNTGTIADGPLAH